MSQLTKHLRLLKEWFIPRPFISQVLSRRENQIGAEIGVYRGRHAQSILWHASISRLYLVDPYKAYTDFDQADLDQAERRVFRCLACNPKVLLVKQSSQDASQTIPALDFAYLDGAHDYESVKQDIALWWPKIVQGGALAGHDFSSGWCADHKGVVQAVTEFAFVNKLQLFVAHSDWWIFKDV